MSLLFIESAAPRFSGRGENGLACMTVVFAFLYKWLDLLYGKNALPGQAWEYMVLLSLFTAVAFSSVFWLATPLGHRWLHQLTSDPSLARRRRLRCLLASAPPLYIGLFLFLLWLVDAPKLWTALQPATVFCLSLPGPLAAMPVGVFLPLAGGLMFTGCWLGLTLSPADVFGLRTLGSSLLAGLPFFLLQEYVPLAWCFATPAVALVMVYGSGLGREYFYFSFVPRSWRSTGFVFALMVAGLLIFLAANAVLGSISYTGALWRSSWHQLYEAVFIHLFIVGVSEELLFRGALLTLAAHWISRRFAPRRLSRFSRSAALLLISVLFGLVHAPHGLLMVFLAFWASLLYGLAFLVGKSLFGPVLLHGLLNVLLMMNYKLSLFQ